jgi:hypothetical protein
MNRKNRIWFLVWEEGSKLPGYGAAYRIRSLSRLREMKQLPAFSF